MSQLDCLHECLDMHAIVCSNQTCTRLIEANVSIRSFFNLKPARVAGTFCDLEYFFMPELEVGIKHDDIG